MAAPPQKKGGEYATGERDAFPHLEPVWEIANFAGETPMCWAFAKWTAFPSSPVASRAQEKQLRGYGRPAAEKRRGVRHRRARRVPAPGACLGNSEFCW